MYRKQAKDLRENVRDCESELASIQKKCGHRWGEFRWVRPSFDDPPEGDVFRDCLECCEVHICSWSGRCKCVVEEGR